MARKADDDTTDKSGLHEAAAKEARLDPQPQERTYKDAMTAEQKAALEKEGLL